MSTCFVCDRSVDVAALGFRATFGHESHAGPHDLCVHAGCTSFLCRCFWNTPNVSVDSSGHMCSDKNNIMNIALVNPRHLSTGPMEFRKQSMFNSNPAFDNAREKSISVVAGLEEDRVRCPETEEHHNLVEIDGSAEEFLDRLLLGGNSCGNTQKNNIALALVKETLLRGTHGDSVIVHLQLLEPCS